MNEVDVKQGLKQLGSRIGRYTLYRAYYDGDQRLAFATDKFKSLFAKMFSEFADNMCPAVVDTATDRTILEGFDPPKDTQFPVELEEALTAIWDGASMELTAAEVHGEAYLTGDAYLIIWPNPDNAGVPDIDCNGADMVTVYYDPERPKKMLWAMKTWVQVDGSRRLTMYYPDRVERYVTPQKSPAWTSLKPSSFIEHPELPVVRNPYGRVPVFHFPNNASLGQFGRSELKPVIPLQDALNKAITDMLVAMEFVALPQRWVTGMVLERDPVTQKVRWPFEAGVDRVWTIDDPNSKFGEFSPANLEHFLKTQDNFRLEVARVSRTPLHYIMHMTGDFPSGEALKTAEAPFTAKVDKRLVVFGAVWADAMTFALEVAGHAAGTQLTARWCDTAPRSEKEFAETLQIDSGLPAPMLRKRGYTDEEIAEVARHQNLSSGAAIMEQFTNGPGAG